MSEKETMKALMFIFCMLLTQFTWADYRAYKLRIADDSAGVERFIASQLDDIQYPLWHPVKLNETISIESTWMCYGNSSYFAPICQDPSEEDL